MNNKKALVFGISGMDGKTITHLLLKKNYEVVGTYRRNTITTLTEIHPIFNNDPRLSFEFCDITDYNSVRFVIEKTMPDEIYLLAAQSHVGFSFESPDSTVMTNGMSVYNVLDNVLKYCKKSRVYFAATSELFGGSNPGPYNETSEFDTRSPYSIGKELGTRWIKYYRHLGIFACYGILFNHSNVYRNYNFFIRRLTTSAARIALGKQNSITFGNLDFWRDEHWSDFGCEMMIKMLQKESPNDYVIANGVTHHGEEFLDAAFGYFNLNWRKHVVIDKSRFRPNEVVKLIGDSSKAQAELGWKPNRMSFKDHIGLMCQNDYHLESGKSFAYPDVFSLYP